LFKDKISEPGEKRQACWEAHLFYALSGLNFALPWRLNLNAEKWLKNVQKKL